MGLFRQRRFIITCFIYLKDLPFWFYCKVKIIFKIYGAKNHEFGFKSMWVIILMNSWLEFLWVEFKMWSYLFSAFLHFFILFRFALWLQELWSYSLFGFFLQVICSFSLHGTKAFIIIIDILLFFSKISWSIEVLFFIYSFQNFCLRFKAWAIIPLILKIFLALSLYRLSSGISYISSKLLLVITWRLLIYLSLSCN